MINNTHLVKIVRDTKEYKTFLDNSLKIALFIATLTILEYRHKGGDAKKTSQ